MANNTGTFFNINDNDGIPLVGVSTNGKVMINHLYGNCLIGSTSVTGTSSQPLQVTGGAYVSGSVGIGTTNPTSALTVKGNTSLETLSVSGVSTFSGNIKTNNSNIVLGDGSGGSNRITLGTNNGQSFPNPDTNFNIYYSSSYGNVIQDTTTSGVGGVQIWTGGGFSVKGQGGIGTQISSLQTGGVQLYHYNSGAYSKTFETLGVGVTITGTTFTNQLSVSGVTTTQNLNVGTAGTIITTNSSGLVSIGTIDTDTEQVTLYVVGSSIFAGNVSISGILTANTFVGDGSGLTGIIATGSGVEIQDDGSPVGTAATINFGNNLTVDFSSGIATISAIGSGGGGESYWTETSAGIHTLSNVGIGTTNPRFALEVGAVGASGTSLYVNGDARVTGILTVGTASITLNGISNIINVGTGITINGSTGTIDAASINLGGTTLTGSAVTSITAGSGISVDQSTGNVTITATGGGGSSQWVTTSAGIHTLSNVGIGTTNPTSALTVKGNTSLETLNVSGVSTVGIITGATYYGDTSNATDGRWTLGANGTSDYTFTGIGFTQTTNDPDLYLTRGRVYEFVNNSGGSHPFQIRLSNGGSAYNDGVTNNGSASGTIRFEVPFNAPNTLYYQCTNHSVMGGVIYILDQPQFIKTNAGIHTLSNVGIGTTNPTSALTVSGNVSVSGVSTLGNTIVGGATTQLVVNGDARITGILTIGTSSITLNGSTNVINVGTGVTIYGNSGIISATTFTGNFSGSITDATNLTGGYANASQLNVSGIATISQGRIQADASSNLRFGNIAAGSGSGRNIAIGDQVLVSLSGGQGRNIGIGELSYYDTTTGQYNIGIGERAGQKVSTGSYNVVLGAYDGNSGGLDIRTSSNNVVLADGQGNIRQYINSSGNVGIKTTVVTEALTVAGIVSATGFYGTLNAGQLTGSLPAIDGSALIGVQGVGSGVEVQDDTTPVGTAGTINFGTNLTVSFAGGTATVSGASSVSTATTAFNLAGSPNLNVGVVTATSFVGNLTGTASFATVAGIATYTSEWILGAVGSSDYTFTGPGFTGAVSDPVLYLVRGQQYKFTNTMGAHPFRIQSTPNGSTGTQYDDGIVNNNVSNGTLTWNVQFNAPGLLYYQCTAHGGMGGKIYIVDAGVGPDISVNTTGIITAASFSGSGSGLTNLQSGQLTGALPAIDGSALLNVTAAGTGIAIRDDNTPVGSAVTVNFGTGLDVTFNSGIATITASGGSLQSRTTVTGVTTSIVNNGIGNTNITGFKSYALMKVGLSTAGWLRLYTDSASRTNDVSRSVGEDPTPGSGVIAEVVTTGISTTQIISPFVMGGNLDNPADTTIYAAITNLSGSTQAITANLTILQLEA